jgi:hypothetical protein
MVNIGGSNPPRCTTSKGSAMNSIDDVIRALKNLQDAQAGKFIGTGHTLSINTAQTVLRDCAEYLTKKADGLELY